MKYIFIFYFFVPPIHIKMWQEITNLHWIWVQTTELRARMKRNNVQEIKRSLDINESDKWCIASFCAVTPMSS
jgi:hypothetical protein